MTYHFTRVTRVAGQEVTHDFDTDSLPAAKKVCRKHWERVAELNTGVEVEVRLHRRSAWTLAGNAGVGDVVALIKGVFGSKPPWSK